MSEKEQDRMIGDLYVKRDKQTRRLACARLRVGALLPDVEQAAEALRYHADQERSPLADFGAKVRPSFGVDADAVNAAIADAQDAESDLAKTLQALAFATGMPAESFLP